MSGAAWVTAAGGREALINGFRVSGKDCISGLWLRVDSRRRTGVGAAVEVRSRWRGRALDEMRRVGVFRRVKWAWCGRNVRPRSRGGQVDDGSGGWAFSVGPRPFREGLGNAMRPDVLVGVAGFDQITGDWNWVEGGRGESVSGSGVIIECRLVPGSWRGTGCGLVASSGPVAQGWVQ